jgi:hypothetical protein
MLTLYLIESPDFKDPGATIESFGGLVKDWFPWENYNFDQIESPTIYYGLMYTSEWIDEGLRIALPAFLEEGFDYISFYKKDIDWTEDGMVTKFYLAPRIFKKSVKLCQDAIRPADEQGLSFERILNGWLWECRR